MMFSNSKIENKVTQFAQSIHAEMATISAVKETVN